MVSYTLAIILWFLDPYLGVIAMVGFPAIEALDQTTYTDVGIAFFVAVGLWFVKRMWSSREY